MTEPTISTIYSVDTSSLMDWQARFYPFDVFPGLVDQIEALASKGSVISPAMVHEELKAVGTSELIAWAKAHSKIFIPTPELLKETQVIQGQFTGLRDPKSEFEEADAYVIALAKLRGGFVVTQETPASEKRKPARTHYIPDVCRELGIPCINLLGLMRREKWKFQ